MIIGDAAKEYGRLIRLRSQGDHGCAHAQERTEAIQHPGRMLADQQLADAIKAIQEPCEQRRIVTPRETGLQQIGQLCAGWPEGYESAGSSAPTAKLSGSGCHSTPQSSVPAFGGLRPR